MLLQYFFSLIDPSLSLTYGADQFKPMPDKRYIVRRGELFQDVALQSSDPR